MKYLAIALILGLLALRLLRGRWGAKFLGVSERAIDIVYIAALVIAGIAAIATQYWLLLALVVVLLVLRLVEALRTPSRRQAASRRRGSARRR
ncbi:hypothetical protein DEO23_09990 [Brachybacterium endophyticum]|uniref:Uncharacterized protein n=1 Tax=Brachybacterium endophyticum TaxID=2182385 RepID=A0A2U2RJV5_9MICO|nr:hypothetical protein [Brachybacterium endophyticum]PWH06126.1 hypothetical protein DEO23_09990 [Brachybacterium endophyticum]